jgi:trans-aconitate methyltransferase
VDLKESDSLGGQVATHWYYRAKSAAIRQLLKDKSPVEILDIGAGSGFFSKEMLSHTTAQKAVCVDTGYDHDWQETCRGKPLSFSRSVGTVEADTVLLMDVLEHVDDERKLLAPYVEAVPSGAVFVVTVPAFGFLWSSHDVFLDHRRRYRLPELVRVVESAGLCCESAHYYYGLVFPIAAAVRLLERVTRSSSDEPKSHLRKQSKPVNAVLGLACAIERPLMRFNTVCGLSVIALFRKP